MITEENVQLVKDFFAAMGSGDRQGLLSLCAEDIEWLAGTHRGHAGSANVLQKAAEKVETSFPEPPEFVAQGDRVLVVGFAITVRNGRVTKIREYIDTQALARASEITLRAPRA
jgi:uncharacterized protein